MSCCLYIEAICNKWTVMLNSIRDDHVLHAQPMVESRLKLIEQLKKLIIFHNNIFVWVKIQLICENMVTYFSKLLSNGLFQQNFSNGAEYLFWSCICSFTFECFQFSCDIVRLWSGKFIFNHRNLICVKNLQKFN